MISEHMDSSVSGPIEIEGEDRARVALALRMLRAMREQEAVTFQLGSNKRRNAYDEINRIAHLITMMEVG